MFVCSATLELRSGRLLPDVSVGDEFLVVVGQNRGEIGFLFYRQPARLHGQVEVVVSVKDSRVSDTHP